MRLVIDKFGIINKASIDINGLTVICGENDTGKSTIGKLIFSLIKSSQKYEDDLEVGAISEIRSSLFKISSLLLLTNDNKETNRLISHNIRRLDPEYLILIKDISILYDNLERAKIDESIREIIEQNIKNIKFLLDNKPDENKIKRDALRKAMFSEFGKLKGFSSYICLSDLNKNNIVSFNINDSNISNVDFGKRMDIDDVTYIENPFILQFRKMFYNAITSLDENLSKRSWMREAVSLHLKDLAKKLINHQPDLIDLINDQELKSLSREINQMIDGDFSYDEEFDDFILNRNGKKISSMNIASGIKSIGLIDTLIRGNVINKNTLLILDEPETNLHPKWQNEYARLLCKFVKNNIRVIAVTHSPYMISALYHYSKDIGENMKSFYWANKENGHTTFEDNTSNVMEGIVSKFADDLDGMY